MTKTGGSRGSQWVRQMPDAYLSQVNPVSDTYYPVLNARNVKVESFACYVTWAVTQPTNLRIRVTVDGNIRIYNCAAPVTVTPYCPACNSTAAEIYQSLVAAGGGNPAVAALFCFDQSSGRDVLVEVAITWGDTQPTPLVCRVKYAVLD